MPTVASTAAFGRSPHALALATTAILVVLSPLRFAVLVGVMSPNDYGYLSVFNTLTSLLPYAVILGLPLEFQRIAARDGARGFHHLEGVGARVLVATLLPAVAASLAVAMVFPAAGDPVYIAILAATTSVLVGANILVSQTLLGAGQTAASIVSLFSYNAMLTVAVLPLALLPRAASVTDVLALWTFAAAFGAGVAGLLYLRARSAHEPAPTDSDVLPPGISLRDGLVSIPMLVGPWLLLFVARVLLGLGAGPVALATFALGWTLVDLAYLVAVNVPTVASRDIMLNRRSPVPVFGVAAAVLAVLVVLGYVVLVGYVSWRSLDYQLPVSVAAALVAVGLVRLGVAAWLPKSVSDRRHGAVSASFIAAAVILVVLLASGLARTAEGGALALTCAFAVVAAVQIRASRGTRR